MRDHRGRSPSPKLISGALESLRREIAPQTALATAQAAWPGAVGERIAAVTTVTDERDGTLFIECQSAVWSQELALMEPRLRAALAEATGGDPPREIRFRAIS